MTTEMIELTAEQYKTIATTGAVIEVIKRNGERRILKCTTNLGTIPAEDHPKGVRFTTNEHLHRVYDLEASGWRTFDDQRVVSFEPL